MLGFKDWLKTTDYKVIAKKSRISELVNDILIDDDFPAACEKYIIYKYFSSLSDEDMKIIDRLYKNYIKFISRSFCDEAIDYDSVFID